MDTKSYVKDIFSNLLEAASAKLHALREKRLQEEHLQQAQRVGQELLCRQAALQKDLCHVLSSTQIHHNLSPIHHPSDLIPAGYSVMGSQPIFQYRWMKKTADAINSTILDISREKMNSAIMMERQKLHYSYTNSPEHIKPLYFQKHPALCEGFQVLFLENDYTDVIISVAFL